MSKPGNSLECIWRSMDTKCKDQLKSGIHETKRGKDGECIPQLEEAFNRGVSNRDQERDFGCLRTPGHWDVGEGKMENGNKTDGNSRNKPGGSTHPQLHINVGWHLRVSILTFVPHPHLYWVTNEREETKSMNVYRCMDSSFSLLSPISHT